MRAASKAFPIRLLRHAFVLVLALVGPASADWPAYRHDTARSGYTAEKLADHLSVSWSFRASHHPQPAWPRSARLTFDRAFQPVVADGLLCFGSSVDGQVYTLDATNGVVRWSFPTDGPVRFAPAFWNGFFYVTSDDGHLYCLEARTGKLRWKKRGAPNNQTVLGNDHLISRWPARGGPVVVDGTVYFAAGIWPSDGIFLYALDAVTGQDRWVNDSADQMYMAQPHPGAYSHSGISPQGYFIASSNHLFVPNGRAVPAAFRLADGKFEYFHLQNNGNRGGGVTVLSDYCFINDGRAYDQATGATVCSLDRACTVSLPDGVLQVTAKDILKYVWTDRERVNRKGKKESVRDLQELWRFAHRGSTSTVEVIVAGNEAVLGEDNRVRRINLRTSNEVWTARVAGIAYGVAVAEGRLYVSTDQGMLYCFSSQGLPAQEFRPSFTSTPYGDHSQTRRAAREIISRTGVTNGYCLDFGCGDGGLAYELARETALRIVAIDPDPANVSLARTRLSQAQLYGSRVTVLQRDLADTGLPPYFANLIISRRSLTELAVPREEASRFLRPYGGVSCFGPPSALVVHTRGPLHGAGNWTHQYANPANTLCSTDDIVHGPLGMLWFTDFDQRLVQRHGRPPAPLYSNGILYSEGRDSFIAIDAYNGLMLWEYPLPGILAAYDGDHLMGASGTGSNFAFSEDSIYIRQGDHCLRLDAGTGQLLGKFAAPPTVDSSAGIWGFIACENNTLFGSLANPEHVVTFRYQKGGNLADQLTESKTLFALDALTGQLKWRYDAKHSLRHNGISLGSGRVVFIDRPQTLYDRIRGEKAAGDQTGELIALDAQTGRELWRNEQDIYGTTTLLSTNYQKLIMCFQPSRFSLASELGERITCFDLSTGHRVWARRVKYQARPFLNDQTLYAEGGAWDLFTGKDRPFPLKRTHGCGILAASKYLSVFRSATLGYFDFKFNQGIEEFGGIRPGCWLNALPVGGLVLLPDAAAGCVCSYPIESWVALRPDGIRPPVIQPAQAASRTPITVNLHAHKPTAEQVRFTLDGSAPTTNSSLWVGPLTLTNSVLLQARSFGPDNRASRVATAQYLVGPSVLLLNPTDWQTWDAPGAKPPSAWKVANGQIRNGGGSPPEISQTANTYLAIGLAMTNAPEAERPGTLHIYRPGRDFINGELALQIHSVDHDTVGVAFRFTDSEHYYLWSMDSERSFHSLAVKDGQTFSCLATNRNGYVPGQWYDLRIRLDGPRITVYLDGQLDLEAEDSRFRTGTFALYAWGDAGVTFRNLAFKVD